MRGWHVGLTMLCLSATLSAAVVPSVQLEVERYAISGPNPLAADTTDAILAPFTGRLDGLDRLLDAAAALEAAFAESGFPFHRVTVPPQTVDAGTVNLKIISFQLGAVVVEGNTHFSADNVRRSVPVIEAGMTPSVTAFADAAAIANRHPSKALTVNLRQSAEPDAIDAVLQVRDRSPWQVFSTLNNIGSKDSGRSRLSFGGQYSNLFGRDHVITGSYTTSPENADDVEQYGIHYRAPVYRYRTFVSAFYTHSDVDTGTVGDFFDVSGSGEFFGVSISHVLRAFGAYQHEWYVGVQDRSFENDVRFLNQPIGTDVRSRPVTFGYAGNYRAAKYAFAFDVAYSRNWSAGDDNNQTAYAASRASGDVEWDALRVNAEATAMLPRDWRLRAVTEAQYSDESLITAEQLGLGGEQSIRGFEERILTGDSGIRFSTEIWTPEAPFLHGLRGLAFTDVGYRHVNNNVIGEVENDTIASVGVGVRYQWREHVSFALDYGNAVAKGQRTIGGRDVGNVKVHASLFMRY